MERLVGRATYIRGARACLDYVDVAADECLKILYPDAPVVGERAKSLIEMGFLKGVQWRELKPVKGGMMSIDSVDDQLFYSFKDSISIDLEKEKTFALRGWASTIRRRIQGTGSTSCSETMAKRS